MRLHQEAAHRSGHIAVVFKGEHLVERVGAVTNNEAEYRALIRGLELALAQGARQVEVLSDSELLVKQLNGEYRVRKANLRPLFQRATDLRARFDVCQIRWISRAENAAGRLLER